MSQQRPKKRYEATCSNCDFSGKYASELVANALSSDHEKTCVGDTEVSEL